jgi:ABC-type bacteriocin/lantibiotic exporter with double-glycine peptidase domain
MSWGSTNYGSAEQVMAEGGGTGLSAQGLYIENLATQGFAAVTGILSINSSFRTFAGYARRISDMLLVIEEARTERAQQEAKKPLDSQEAISTAHVDENSLGEIVFREVDIFAPDGQQIVSKLSLTLAHGEHLRVTGPNGCGKSAVPSPLNTPLFSWHSPSSHSITRLIHRSR